MGKQYTFSLEEVARILYDFVGDRCACNYNNIGELLCDNCKYIETDCPCPNDILGCWKEYLIHIKTHPKGVKSNESTKTSKN